MTTIAVVLLAAQLPIIRRIRRTLSPTNGAQ